MHSVLVIRSHYRFDGKACNTSVKFVPMCVGVASRPVQATADGLQVAPHR